jgi:hypothetical protein
MLKLFVKFILLLGLVLVGSYALTWQYQVCYASENVFGQSAPADHTSLEHPNVPIFRAASSSTGKLHDKVKAVEIEDDDESMPFRKYTETVQYGITFFYTQVPGYDTHQHYNNRLPFCDHFSRSSSHKFIVNRVIRI